MNDRASLETPATEKKTGTSRIRGNGPFADLYRTHDWSATSLGPIDSWPDILIASVNTLLAADIPMQYFWGPDGNCLYNEAMRPHLSTKHPASLGQPARHVWAEAWEIIGPQIESVMETATSVHFDDVFLPLMREGKLVGQYWTYSYSPLFDGSGQVVAVLDISQETTEKVLALRDLTLERARLDAIIESVPVGVLVADRSGRILRGNTELDRVLRHPVQISNSVSEYGERYAMHPDGRRFEPHEYPMARAIIEGKRIAREEFLYRRGDGTTGWIGVTAAPILDEAGTVLGGVVAVSDIHEERISRDTLRRSEERFRQLVGRAGIGINIGDASGNLTYINPAMLQLIGYTREEVERGDIRWSDITPPEFKDADNNAIRQLREHGIAEPYEKVYIAKDGRRIPVLLHAANIPCLSGDSSQEDIAVFFTDLTQQKRSEAVLLQTEKLAAVGRLASTIAHEINNPLEAVTNLLYLSRLNTTDPNIRTWLDMADAETRRMAAIAQQTLRFHRQASAPQSVTSSSLFTSTLDLYAARLRNNGIAVEKLRRVDTPVLCFEGDIRQVLSNLVANAIDAMPNGGRLLVRSREGTDWKTGRRGLYLTIADTGTGMSRAVRQRVFEAFYSTKGINGTGLGLWICTEIMERHQGRILLHSRAGTTHHGTAVSIFLPFDSANPAQ
ncbi:PAS domain S-box protein [Silvibacterium sp.]|uniref:PAS domain S-box protein n=1 Tax=Silvibacterium sp. TaxID=1964179 RepID=UPI0039E5910E